MSEPALQSLPPAALPHSPPPGAVAPEGTGAASTLGRLAWWGAGLLAALVLLLQVRQLTTVPLRRQQPPLVVLPAGVDPAATSGAPSVQAPSIQPRAAQPGPQGALAPPPAGAAAGTVPAASGPTLLLPGQPGFRSFPGWLSREGDPQGTYLRSLKDYVTQHPQALLQKQAFNSEINLLPTLDELGIRPQDVVLDLGCGLGALEFRLLRERTPFARLYAADQERLCSDFLACALGVVPAPDRTRIQALACEQGRLELPDASVDLVILFDVPLGAAYASSRWPPSSVAASARNLADLHRVLKPGGRVYLRLTQEVTPADVLVANYARAGFALVSQTLEKVDSVSHFVKR